MQNGKAMTSFLKTAVFTTTLLLWGTAVFASNNPAGTLQVKLDDPVWRVMLNNHAIAQRTAAIAPNEQSFAGQLRPLLQQKNYQAIAGLFRQRPLDDDSAALQVLRGQVLLSLQQYDDAASAF